MKYRPGETTQLRPLFSIYRNIIQRKDGITSNSYYEVELQYRKILLLVLRKGSSTPLAVFLPSLFELKICYFSKISGICFFQSRNAACTISCFPYLPTYLSIYIFLTEDTFNQKSKLELSVKRRNTGYFN